MTQLQICIEFRRGKLRVELNRLRREDATDEESTIVDCLEKMVMGLIKSVAKDAGLNLRERKLKPIATSNGDASVGGDKP